jgi:hypothetical protein
MTIPWDDTREEMLAKLLAEAMRLEHDLQEAHKAYLVATEKHIPKPKRTMAIGVLSAFANYAKALGIDRTYWVSLLELWGALDDAKRGLQNPLTAPDYRERGSPTVKTKHALDTALAAAAVTALQRKNRRGAYAIVAGATGISSDELRTDLKDIRKGRAPAPVIKQYNRLLATLGQYVGLPLDEQTEAILKVLKNDLRV